MTRLYFADQIDISPCYALEMLKERYTHRSADWMEGTFSIIANDFRNATLYMQDVFNYDPGHKFVTDQFKSPEHIAAFMNNAMDPWSMPTEAELDAMQDLTGHKGWLYLDPQPRDAIYSLLTLFASFWPTLNRRTV
jgi:hypothetical protein